MGFQPLEFAQVPTFWGSFTTATRMPREQIGIPPQKQPHTSHDVHSYIHSTRVVKNVYQSCFAATLYAEADLTVLKGVGQGLSFREHFENREMALDAIRTGNTTHILNEQTPHKSSRYSLSIDSTTGMDDGTRTRRRAKTPVFAIGQLERHSLIRDSSHWAQTLADEYEYQAELPSRTVTRCISRTSSPGIQRKPSVLRPETSLRLRPHKLRKIKCQVSLRDLVKEHSSSPPATPFSDDETLLGSESPRSSHRGLSPTTEKFHLPPIKEVRAVSSMESLSKVSSLLQGDSDIGLKICVDLLTNELSSTLCSSPSRGERAPGLQILLMIEAYEAVQQHVRQKAYHHHVRGLNSMSHLEQILDHWLQVLYGVYDRSQTRTDEQQAIDDCWESDAWERSETPESGYASANEDWQDDADEGE